MLQYTYIQPMFVRNENISEIFICLRNIIYWCRFKSRRGARKCLNFKQTHQWRNLECHFSDVLVKFDLQLQYQSQLKLAMYDTKYYTGLDPQKTNSLLSTAVNITKICELSFHEITSMTLRHVVNSCAMVVLVMLLIQFR